MVFCGGLMVLPILVGLIYNEGMATILPFAKTIFLILLIFLPLARKKPKDQSLYVKEGLIITGLIWVIMSFFGGLPFYFSGVCDNLTDAFFESASGFTTTGATIIADVEVVAKSILFWRSFTHYIGGMGVLVLVIALLPEVGMSSVQVMKAEVTGPSFGKILPRLKSSARLLYMIYTGMTIALILTLILAGMPIFDSIVNAFSTAGTGGFAITNDSISAYNSPLIEIILALFMMAFSINFNLYYAILIGKARQVIKSEELRIFVLIVAISTGLIGLNIKHLYDSLGIAIKDAFFTVTTIMSTTGFSTANFDIWPSFSKMIILALMIIGGCAGSTAGGLKITRLIILFKSSKNQLKKVLQPNRVQSVHLEGKILEPSNVEATKSYFVIYWLLIFFSVGMFSLNNHGVEESFSAAISIFNNVGPGFETIGPKLTFTGLPVFTKLYLILIMILGRLEIFPILILFFPSTWKEV